MFIPIAEQTGLIAQMGSWVIQQACMDAVTWPDDITVSVNISAFQFKDANRLIETVKDALLISRLAPNRLELEVTESLLIEDQKSTLETIRALRRIGVRFSLDDFGTGYSSLGYLAHYPFSKVKIDRSFAKNVTTDTPSRSIIEAVCGLANRLGLHVVVEGIETEEQRRKSRRSAQNSRRAICSDGRRRSTTSCPASSARRSYRPWIPDPRLCRAPMTTETQSYG